MSALGGFTLIIMSTHGFSVLTCQDARDAKNKYHISITLPGVKCVATYLNNDLIDIERAPEFRRGDKTSRDFAESLRTKSSPSS